MNSLFNTILRHIRIWKIRPHLKSGVVLCDIGCGPHAKLLYDLSGYIKEGIGLDKKILESREGNITLKNIFIEDKLPMPDKSVDAITLLAVLEHLEKPVEILKEAKRILRSEGILLITVPTPFNRPFGEFLSRFDATMRSEYSDHKRYYSKSLLREHLASAGFDLSKVKINYFELGMNLFAKITA